MVCPNSKVIPHEPESPIKAYIWKKNTIFSFHLNTLDFRFCFLSFQAWALKIEVIPFVWNFRFPIDLVMNVIGIGSTIYIFHAEICNGDFTGWIKCHHHILLHMVNQQCGHFSCVSWPHSASCQHFCWKLHKQHVWREVNLHIFQIRLLILVLLLYIKLKSITNKDEGKKKK